MSRVCIVIALICFVFATFNFSPVSLNMIALGLAFWCGSQLV